MTKEQRERHNAHCAKVRAEHPERNRAAVKKYRALHPERVKASGKKYAKAHPEVIREKRKRYVKANPEKARATDKAWRERNLEQARERARVRHARNPGRRYGLTAEEFAEMRQAQNGACAICKERFTKSPRVDHDHATGAVRGMLCFTCNVMLGLAKDDPERMDAAAAYLRQHKAAKLTLIVRGG